MANATSIVDYLSSRGFTSSGSDPVPLWSTRKSIYGSSGFTLGDYRGSPEQNTALLNYLMQAERNTGVSLTPDNLMSQINVASGKPTPTATSTTTPTGQYTGYVKTPDNATVYGVDAAGSYTPLSYEQYIASGGPSNFSTTKVVGQIPTQQSAATTIEEEGMPPELMAAIGKIQNPLEGRDLAQEAIDKFT